MSRLAVALTLLAGGLVSLHHDTPGVLSASAPTPGKHRHAPTSLRVSRSVRRLPLASKPRLSAKARNPESRPNPSRSPRSADLRPAGAPLHDWSGVADCESGGDWHIDTGNSFYGGLQITQSTWTAFGGDRYTPRPDLASRAQQIQVAEHILAGQGIGAWPTCGRYLTGEA